MTFIKILALIGALLVGIPILCGICYMLWEFAQFWLKMTWDERLNLMFQIGFIISISAAMGWIILASHEKPITADASTDNTKLQNKPLCLTQGENMEIKINGGKLFLDGKEIKLNNDNGILCGKIFVVEEKDILVSAGDLRIDGDHVLNLSPDEFEELKGGVE